ncbi:MAG: GNAT family N-acetyltransferase [Thermoguttaceae bacterium]|nr:GNAT family N-acetyltransferase [Thermoguttaceae bacterium]MBQ6826715.1 GNAT family N-acetyltransferase [Thermoguttaceae bacterium]
MSVFNEKEGNGGAAVDPEAFRARPNRRTTPRLELTPLTLDEFALYLSDVDALADVLRLAEPPSEPDAETRAAFNWLFENALALDAASLCWSTLWAAISRSENRVVGFLCFKGPPRPFFDFLETAPNFKIAAATAAKTAQNAGNAAATAAEPAVETARAVVNERAETGENAASTAVVEIGYGVDKAFRGRGLATEAVGALVDWGREREDVGAILAETLTANLPSRRVLEKCGFRRCGESTDALFWRVDVSRRAGEKVGVDGF